MVRYPYVHCDCARMQRDADLLFRKFEALIPCQLEHGMSKVSFERYSIVFALCEVSDKCKCYSIGIVIYTHSMPL